MLAAQASLLACAVFVSSTNVLAADFQQRAIAEYNLKPLSSSAKAPPQTSEQAAKTTIAMVYQPDCKWCKKQGKWLNKAQAQCAQNLGIVLIGNNGDKRQLKRELKHFHQDMPAFLANRKLFAEVGGVAASPTTLVFNQEGKLIAKQRGYVDDATLSDVAQKITQGQCVI